MTVLPFPAYIEDNDNDNDYDENHGSTATSNRHNAHICNVHEKLIYDIIDLELAIDPPPPQGEFCTL